MIFKPGESVRIIGGVDIWKVIEHPDDDVALRNCAGVVISCDYKRLVKIDWDLLAYEVDYRQLVNTAVRETSVALAIADGLNELGYGVDVPNEAGEMLFSKDCHEVQTILEKIRPSL